MKIMITGKRREREREEVGGWEWDSRVTKRAL
jgi:hypothetical protein